MKKAAILLALGMAAGCAHQGGPGELGSERGSSTSIEPSVGSASVDAEVSREIENTPAEPAYRQTPDPSGPGTRGQAGVNSPTQGRTTTGQETNYLLNKDRGSVRSATDRFRPGGDYTGADDSRGRVLLTPGLDPGSAPERTQDDADTQPPADDNNLAPGVSTPPSAVSGDDVPRASADQNEPQSQADEGRDDLAGLRALSVAPYRSSSGSRFTSLGSPVGGMGRSGMSVTGSSSGFSAAETGSSLSTSASTRYGTLSTDLPAPGLSTAFAAGQETSFGPQDRHSTAYSSNPEQRVGTSASAAVGAAAGTDLSRGLPIEALRNVDIMSNNGQLTLRGTVGSDSERINIENRVRDAVGLRAINNQLMVSPGHTLPGESQLDPGQNRAD